MIKRIVICLAAAALLAGCGQKATSRTHSAISPAPVATPQPSLSPAAASAASATGSAAPVPSSLNCAPSQPVWINERTHVYHVAGDPYYGRTKHGRYLCETDARKEGFRAAHSR